MLRIRTLAALFVALPTIALAQVQSGDPRSGVRSGEPLSGVRGGTGVGVGSSTSGSGASGGGASGSGVSSPDQFISTPGQFAPNNSFTPNTPNTPNTPFTPNSGGR
jgi:hypothetical protein